MLTQSDPSPVEFIPSGQSSRILLVCDHAGDAIPAKYQHKRPSDEDMKRHIAIDVNAIDVAKTMAKWLDAPLVLQRYSRLIIDVNRPLMSPELCPKTSDGTLIRFNQNLDQDEIKQRLDCIYRPYHNTIARKLDEMSDAPAALIAIHSFTPKLRNQPPRYWHVDIMSRTHTHFAETWRGQLAANRPNLNIGVNKVFAISDQRDNTLPLHAEPRNILNASVEVRNDLLNSEQGTQAWGELLAQGLKAALPAEYKTTQV